MRRCAALAAWLATGAPACFSPEIAVGLPCFDGDPACPAGQVCDTAADMCVPDSALGTWRDDAAADFADPTAVLTDATIEAAGAIGPAPYFVEGVATFGIDAPAIGFDNEDLVSWDSIAAQPTTGRGFYRELDLDYAGTTPLPGTGLDTTSGVTIRIEGEIYLLAGTSDVQLSADDRGLFDVGDPATGAFVRAVADGGAQPASGTITVPADGWYPFHGALEGNAGDIHYRLSLADPGGGNLDDVDLDRLRVRVDDVTGLALDGFDDAYLFTPSGTSIATASIGDEQDFGDSGSPPDVGDLGGGSWTVRWSGQVLVEVAGAYSFTLDTRGGHRMWLDGTRIADLAAVAADPEVSTTPPVMLDAGWHDIVIDVMKDTPGQTTPAYMKLAIADGPELAGAFFPLDRQRPVVGRGARWDYDASTSAVAIPDVGSASKSVFINLPSGAVALHADYAYGLTHPVLASVGVDLARPGTSGQLVAPGSLSGAGAYGNRLRFDDLDANGSWTLTASDVTADVMAGSITSARLAVTYFGGTPPFPTHAVYTSRVRELGPTVVAISGVRWQARQERDGGVVAVFVRSCDTADACAAEPWHQIARSGDAAGIAPRPFLQYMIDITTGGDVATGVDWIELDYRLP